MTHQKQRPPKKMTDLERAQAAKRNSAAIQGERSLRTQAARPSSPLTPSVALLTKLASIISHVEEMQSPAGHQFDLIAFRSVMEDPEVTEWMKKMYALALLPEKR